eukprot:1900925-Rhodomonas_salina.1
MDSCRLFRLDRFMSFDWIDSCRLAGSIHVVCVPSAAWSMTSLVCSLSDSGFVGCCVLSAVRDRYDKVVDIPNSMTGQDPSTLCAQLAGWREEANGNGDGGEEGLYDVSGTELCYAARTCPVLSYSKICPTCLVLSYAMLSDMSGTALCDVSGTELRVLRYDATTCLFLSYAMMLRRVWYWATL